MQSKSRCLGIYCTSHTMQSNFRSLEFNAIEFWTSWVIPAPLVQYNPNFGYPELEFWISWIVSHLTVTSHTIHYEFRSLEVIPLPHISHITIPCCYKLAHPSWSTTLGTAVCHATEVWASSVLHTSVPNVDGWTIPCSYGTLHQEYVHSSITYYTLYELYEQCQLHYIASLSSSTHGKARLRESTERNYSAWQSLTSVVTPCIMHCLKEIWDCPRYTLIHSFTWVTITCHY